MNGLTITVALAATIVTYDAMKQGELPMPKRYIAIAGIWGALGFVAQAGAAALATAFAVGLVIAMLYVYVLTGSIIKDKTPAPVKKSGGPVPTSSL